jgi:hemoglobin
VGKAGFKYLVWEIVNQATGGPTKYTGRDMKTAHWHLHITNQEWDAFAKDFKDTLDHFKVPAKAQTALFEIVGPLKKDIVNESPDHVPAPPPADADADPKSLYKRLGGIYAVAAVVDKFIDTIMVDDDLNANPKVARAHHKVAPAGFKSMVTQFVAQAVGGPQVYPGRSMHDAHWDLDITPREWDKFAKDFGDVLKDFNVPEKETKELFALVGPLEPQITHMDL